MKRVFTLLVEQEDERNSIPVLLFCLLLCLVDSSKVIKLSNVLCSGTGGWFCFLTFIKNQNLNNKESYGTGHQVK